MRRWHKTPYWLRDAAYCSLPANARGVFHGLWELLADEPTLVVTVPILSRWLSLEADIVRRALVHLGESGLLAIARDDHTYTITTPERAEAAAAVSQPCSADDVTVSQACSAGVVAVSQPCGDDVATVSRSCSDRSRNDAGLPSPSLIRIEEKRLEERREEDPPARTPARETSLSEAQLAKLVPLCQGTLLRPGDLPGRLQALVARKVSSGQLSLEVLQALRLLADDPERYVAWIVEAVTRAKASAHKPSLVLDYAAGVIARSLEVGEDLTKVLPLPGPAPQAATVPAEPIPDWKQVW